MNLHLDLIVIFLVLDAVSVWSSRRNIRAGNDSLKQEGNTVKLSPGIANNPFLQNAFLPNVEGNPFLQHLNRTENQFGVVTDNSLPQRNESGNSVFSDSRINTTHYNLSEFYIPPPVTHLLPPYRPSSYTPELKPQYAPLGQSPIKIGLPKTRSELKCEEYARGIAGITEITTLVGTSADVIRVDNICRDANRLVVGGVEASIGEFPHMVALGRINPDGSFKLICGGSLISHTWVLSAAHCTYGPNGGPTTARVGFHTLTDNESGIQTTINKTMRHPEHRAPAMYADIALIQLAIAVTFTTTIRPACLYQVYDSVPPSAWVSGWGVTEIAGDQSNTLQKAQLELVDNLACTLRYNTTRKEVPHGVTPSMICAGDIKGNWKIDSCQGDSGGPLQVIHPQNLCLFQVIGIVSFGEACALNAPGVYTRVSHYLPWIENNVWPRQ